MKRTTPPSPKKIARAVALVRQHNEWRRGRIDALAIADSHQLGAALDVVCAALSPSPPLPLSPSLPLPPVRALCPECGAASTLLALLDSIRFYGFVQCPKCEIGTRPAEWTAPPSPVSPSPPLPLSPSVRPSA